VPRGALLDETLDALERHRRRRRRGAHQRPPLLFADVGIVTMRPSDVPTYVEAGAADLGIVGKDVLIEQSERQVFELLDLGYGGCTMVLATVAGEPDPRPRRCGAWASCGWPRSTRAGGALPRGHRAPGGDRRGQGLGRARRR
jgi:ATP phosphoribosyltransferase